MHKGIQEEDEEEDMIKIVGSDEIWYDGWSLEVIIMRRRRTMVYLNREKSLWMNGVGGWEAIHVWPADFLCFNVWIHVWPSRITTSRVGGGGNPDLEKRWRINSYHSYWDVDLVLVRILLCIEYFNLNIGCKQLTSLNTVNIVKPMFVIVHSLQS